jgi:16S rRNA (cytosine967-C5)-methyltransferase
LKKQKRPENARLAAVAAVSAVLEDHMTLNEHFQSASGLSPRDAAYARHLAYGVLRWLSALEWIAGELTDRPIKKREKDIKLLVLVGIFQIWKDETADHAAVHATAECARLLGKHWAVGLVNAVLRRFQREQKELLTRLGETREQHAHPAWLLDALKKDWPETWTEIVSQNNTQAALWLRHNPSKSDRQALLDNLQSKEFTVSSHSLAKDALSIAPAAAVQNIPGFADGEVSVQDPAAQLAATYVDPQPGERILDACAAPGGKTCHLLERQPDINLLALDRDTERLKLIRENLDRLGLNCKLKTADAGCPNDWWDGKPFDKILLDAPCSTTGVIRRHPEIKWLRDEKQVQNAIRAQKTLLSSLWPLLNAGGILVYATCSILKSENHEQIHGFLSDHADAEIVGPGDSPDKTSLPGRQIAPGEEGMDGFYYAIIRKSS